MTPDRGVVAFDVASGKLIHKFCPLENHWVMNGTVLSLDGKTLASIVNDKEVRFWDLATRVELSQRRIHAAARDHLMWLRYAADGRTLAGGTCPWDPWFPKARIACVHLWDAGTGRLLRTFEGKGDQEIVSLAFSLNGRLLAYGALERKPERRPGAPPDLDPRLGSTVMLSRVRLWEVATGKEVLTCHRRSWGAPSANGRYLLTDGEERGMTLWDAIESKPLHTFPTDDSYINSGRFLADGKTVVTCNSNGSAMGFTALYFWDVGSKMKPLPKGPVLEAKTLARLWEELGGADTLHARKAMWALVASPGQSVAFLRKGLRPAADAAFKADDARGIEKLIAALDSSHFASRVHARGQLTLLDRHAEPALRRALKNPPSPQQKKEIEAVLKAME